MDCSTTPTRAFHEDPGFSMGNMYSPSACKTEKKKTQKQDSCVFWNSFTQFADIASAFLGSCFLFSQVNQKLKETDGLPGDSVNYPS